MKTKPILPEIPASWLVLATIAVLGIMSAFALMMLNPNVLLILFAGVFLGIAIKPAVVWLARRGLPQEMSAVLIFIAILVMFGLFIAYALPLLTMQTINLTDALSQGYTNFRNSLINIPNLLINQLVRTLPDDLSLFQPVSGPSAEPGSAGNLEGAGKVLEQILGTGLGLVFVFFLAINWSVEGDRFLRTVLLLSNQRRDFLREMFAQIEDRLSRYLTGLSLLTLIVGALALVGYLIIGLPYALVLAVFAGIMEAVPVIGPAIGALPAIIIALSISPGDAAAVIVLSVLIQGAENIWLFPKVMGTSTGVPPFVTLIAMLAFSALFGIAGAFIAIPVAAVAQVLFDSIVEKRRDQISAELGRDRISTMRYEIKELVGDIRTHAQTNMLQGDLPLMGETLEAIAIDLDTLLQQTTSQEPV